MAKNIEDYRDYCLSLGADVEEKLPFTMFKSGENVLVFYVCGHMFAFFDCADYSVVTLKCRQFHGARHAPRTQTHHRGELLQRDRPSGVYLVYVSGYKGVACKVLKN